MPLFLLPFLVAPPPKEVTTTHTERMAHVVGARLDYGRRGLDFGLAYLHTHESITASGGLGGMLVLQYGLDGRLVRHDGDFRGGMLFGTGRLSFIADTGGLGLEAALGTTFTHDAKVVAEGGVFWGAYFFEVGYTYQFPIGGERPEWLSSHQLSFRVHVPVAHHHERTWTEKRTPGPS